MIATHRFLFSALSSLDIELDHLARDIGADNLGVKLELEALLLQNPLELLAVCQPCSTILYSPDLRIHSSADGTKVLDNGNVGPKSAPDGTQLQTNDTTSNNDELMVSLLECQGGRARTFLGTSCRSKAPVDETTLFSSISIPGNGVTSDPVAMIIFLASI